ncbi:MAG: hypothetical protein OHK0024_27360 [Thalassobaculales bacterium]
MRYTPGPWKIRTNGEITAHGRGSAGSIGSISWSGRTEDRAGNLKLVAAAPQMSEALDELYLLVCQRPVAEAIAADAKLLAKARLILENARTILAEATGKPVRPWPQTDPRDTRLAG